MTPKKQLVPNSIGYWWKYKWGVWHSVEVIKKTGKLWESFEGNVESNGKWGGKCNTPKWKPKLK